jgi:hypothetical protein
MNELSEMKLSCSKLKKELASVLKERDDYETAIDKYRGELSAAETQQRTLNETVWYFCGLHCSCIFICSVPPVGVFATSLLTTRSGASTLQFRGG